MRRTKELFVCVRFTIEDEDPSLNMVDVERLERAIRRGFPYAPSDWIEVEEIQAPPSGANEKT